MDTTRWKPIPMLIGKATYVIIDLLLAILYLWVVGNLVTYGIMKSSQWLLDQHRGGIQSMAHGICELLWLKMLLAKLGLPFQEPMILYYDKAAISIAHNLVQYDRTEHVKVDRYFIKEHLKFGCICTQFIQKKDQLVDIFTKGLSGV